MTSGARIVTRVTLSRQDDTGVAGRVVNYSFQFGALAPYGDLIVEGAFQTLRLSAITMAVGLAIGLAGALARTSRVALARWAATAYVEIIRNTPLLVQLFVVFFGLPSLGVKLGAGDGVRVRNAGDLEFGAARAAEVLVFDLRAREHPQM